MIKLTEEKVLLLHQLISEETGADDEGYDAELLNAALESAFETVDGEEIYPTKHEKGARICFSLVTEPAFADSNVQIGLYVLLTFLEVNGVKLRPTAADLARVGIALANGEMDYDDLLEWVLENEA